MPKLLANLGHLIKRLMATKRRAQYGRYRILALSLLPNVFPGVAQCCSVFSELADKDPFA